MPIYSGGGGVGGITVEEDPSALKMAQNLADLQNAGTARTNLGVYSTSETDSNISYVVNQAIGNIPPYSYTVPTYNVVDSTWTPDRASINNGTITLGGGMGNYINLDGQSGSWQVGDRFAVASTGYPNSTINANTNNWINGSNTSHSINNAAVHWCVLVNYDSNNSSYYWAIG
jgi:hypothetical protein